VTGQNTIRVGLLARARRSCPKIRFVHTEMVVHRVVLDKQRYDEAKKDLVVLAVWKSGRGVMGVEISRDAYP